MLHFIISRDNILVDWIACEKHLRQLIRHMQRKHGRAYCVRGYYDYQETWEATVRKVLVYQKN